MRKADILLIIFTFMTCAGAAAENGSYIIKKGDTLYSISKRFNIPMDSLSKANGINDPSLLYPGMKIEIPKGYIVSRGDTFYGIAVKHGISLEKLYEINNLGPEDVLMPGQVLTVTVTAESHISAGESAVKSENEKKEVMATVEPETVATAVVKSTETSALPTDNFWPLYGNMTAMTGKLEGIQIEGKSGDQITAVAGGTVVWASEYGIYKYLVLIESLNGYVYGYGGNQRAIVSVGDKVTPGTIIGILGGAEKSSAAYFFVYKDGKAIDPEKAPRI